jgi:hypothetical protein
MDPILTDVYVHMSRHHGASVDDILVDPLLRGEFLTLCRRSISEDVTEEKILRRLAGLRKHSKLPRAKDIPAA